MSDLSHESAIPYFAAVMAAVAGDTQPVEIADEEVPEGDGSDLESEENGVLIGLYADGVREGDDLSGLAG